MQKTILILCLFLYSCSRLPQSEGEFNEIIIFSSEEDVKFVDSTIKNLFSEIIYTPSEEKVFQIRWIEPKKINNYLNYSNLLFISLDSPRDSTIDALSKRFENIYNEKVFLLDDLYAKNQVIMFLICNDSIDFELKIKDYSNWLIENFSANIDKKISHYLNKFNSNSKIEELLYDNYNIKMNIQEDYMIIKNDTVNSKFTWIGRGFPYRWLTFTVLDSFKVRDVWIQYEKLLNENMTNVKISKYYKNIVFQSENIIKIQGLYEEKYSDTGGPFFAYINYDENSEKAIAVSGFVNNPGKKKGRLLRELEVLIKNINYEE